MNIQKKRLIGAKALGTLILIVMLISTGHPHIIMDVLGFILIVVAGVGRIWSSAYISGFKSGKVVKEGAYSLMRNPLYFFSFLGFLGVGLIFGSIIISILLVGVFGITHMPIIKYEEKKLHGLFGQEYEDYYKSTPRFFPKFSLFSNPETIQFYPRKFTKTLIEATYLIFSYGVLKLIVWLHQVEFLPNIWSLY